MQNLFDASPEESIASPSAQPDRHKKAANSNGSVLRKRAYHEFLHDGAFVSAKQTFEATTRDFKDAADTDWQDVRVPVGEKKREGKVLAL